MGNGNGNSRPAAGPARPTARGAEARLGVAFDEQPAWLEALHLAGLWTIAVTQPLFDLLGRGPEFLVAHDTRPGDLLGLVILLSLAGPACLLPLLRVGRRMGPISHAWAAGVAVGALTAAVALVAVKQATDWNRDLSFTVAALCGVLFAVGYVRVATVRLFATLLSAAAIVVPALFLAQPAIAPLLSSTGGAPPETVAPERPSPIVVVVFDQLPLVSLLDAAGGLDRTLYPNFAALADDGTWFPNASTVSGWTQTALPAILTGNYPRSERLPTANDHPVNLFNLLGSHYDLHVAEPLTDLCPETLCPSERAWAAAWYGPVLADLAVVYLHAILPDDLANDLPPLTQGWRNFAPEDELLGRWNQHRHQDRHRTAMEFIEAIDGIPDGGRSSLHFLHSLLPHEPWVHLPTGQRHSLRGRIIGAVRDHWRDDAWAVTLEYQRHLLQVQLADSLLGDLLQRLHTVGLYDDALVVVTADHGASLRPGTPFRQTTAETFAEVAAVPLIIKRPGQRHGRISTENIETIDILPTVAAEIGLRLPRNPDGTSVFSEKRPTRPRKSMLHPEGQHRMHGPGDLRDAVADAVAHKLARFASGDPSKPRLGLHDDLVGVAVAELASSQPAGFDVVVDGSMQWHDVDREAEFLPVRIIGGIVGGNRDVAVPPLAIALNGVVAAVTRTYSFRAFGHATPWEVIVDPRQLATGPNELRVFAIRSERDGTVLLDEATDLASLRQPTNLVPELAELTRGVTSSGLLSTQSSGHGNLRWTTGTARLFVPIDPRFPPSALTIRILTTGPQKRLRLAISGCLLFEGPIFGRWEESFPLEDCRLDTSPVVIELDSNVHLGDRPGLSLGVAVSTIELEDGGQQR